MSKRLDVASVVEWVGTVGAAGWWALTGVRRYIPGQGTWLMHTSNANLLVGVGLLAAALVARRLRRGHFFRQTPFDGPLLLFVLGALVGWGVSYNHERDLLRLALLLGAVAFFYLLADASSGGTQRFVACFVLVAIVLMVVFLMQHDFESDPVRFNLANRIGLYLTARVPDLGLARIEANPNVAACLAAVAMPFSIAAVGQLRRERRWFWMGGLVLVMLFLAFGMLVASSRGALAALAATGLLWAVFYGGGRLGGARAREVLFLAALIAGIGLYGWSLSRPDVLGTVPGQMDRTTLYRDSFYLARDYLFTGAGLGAFPMVHASYSLLTHVGFIDHSHQWYLQVWLEQGLLGGIAVLWMVVIVVRLILQSSGETVQRLWTIAAAGWASMILMLHGLVDAPLYADDQSMLLLIPFGLMIAGRAIPEVAEEGRPRRRVLAVWIGLIVGLAATIVVFRRPVAAAVHANLGAVEQTQIELREYSWPEWPIQDDVRRQVDLSRPIAAFRRALILDPGNATANRRLGMIALSRGEYAAALEHLEMAYDATPGDNATRQLLGEAYIVNGRLDDGAALWAGVNNDQSELDIRAFWYDYIGDKERAAWVAEVLQRIGQ